MNRWWAIHDDIIRDMLQRVEVGEVSKEEAYAQLCELSESENVETGES